MVACMGLKEFYVLIKMVLNFAQAAKCFECSRTRHTSDINLSLSVASSWTATITNPASLHRHTTRILIPLAKWRYKHHASIYSTGVKLTQLKMLMDAVSSILMTLRSACRVYVNITGLNYLFLFFISGPL